MSIELIIINIFLFLSLIAMIFIIGYAIPKKQSIIIRQIGLLTFITFVYVLGYLIELNSVSLDAKRFWNIIQYLAIPSIPAIWVLIAMNYINLKLKPIHKVIIFFIPLLTYVMRFTNSLHHLYYVNTFLEDTQIGYLMSIEYGLFYYFHVGYIAVCFVAANILYLIRYKKVEKVHKKRLVRISLSSFAPWVGVFLNIIFANSYPLDYTALLFPITILIFIYSLREEHRISISPFARNLMFMSSSEAVIVVNRDKKIIDYNDKANEIFINLKQYYNDDVCSLTKLVPAFPCEMGLDQKTMMRVFDNVYQVLLRGIKSDRNELLGYVYSFSDITENVNLINLLRANEERIKELIYRDVLTGIPNRNYLDLFIKEEKHLLCRYILMIDMNELKYVNDHFGHQRGDQLIISLANLIQGKLNENDKVIRLSGDEFLIFSNIHKEDELKAWINSLVEEAVSIDYLSFAIGYAKVDKNRDFSMMYKLAEDQMYLNKKEMKLPKR